ncbi:hypothetical protein MTO96_003507 [Rhipicephalus appendiculatus]
MDVARSRKSERGERITGKKPPLHIRSWRCDAGGGGGTGQGVFPASPALNLGSFWWWRRRCQWRPLPRGVVADSSVGTHTGEDAAVSAVTGRERRRR